jgi:death-on-curing protein
VALRFLRLDEALVIHEYCLKRYGGARGVRDVSLLASALSGVKATFDGSYLHETVVEMAAAYLYYICRNIPFAGGNKRTAVGSALVFLRLNGKHVRFKDHDFYALVIAVAEGRASKSAVAVFLENHAA